MEQYNVTGMSCAACSARVEKAVGKVPGVTSCSVSLLTNSMGVEGSADPSEIIAAVEGAGYGVVLSTEVFKIFIVRVGRPKVAICPQCGEVSIYLEDVSKLNS